MTDTAPGTGGRRRGRPPRTESAGTRERILDAAREEFAERGYEKTSVRGIAKAAGVDSALVHHYFGSKDDLFIAALEIPVDPRQVVPMVFAEGVEGAGERLMRMFLSVWEDPEARLPLIALVRASLGEAGPVNLLREGVLRMIFTPLREILPGDDAEERVQLVLSQLVGLVVARYVLAVEPLASMPPEDVVAWVAPTVQRYLDGDR